MQKKLTSEGVCLFCGKTFTKAGINRHLATHLKEKVKSGEPGKSFFVKIETNKRWESTPYFLSLWIDGEAKMKVLDNFLRDIWLDCCGHMSVFRDPQGRTFDIPEDEDEDEDEYIDEDEGEGEGEGEDVDLDKDEDEDEDEDEDDFDFDDEFEDDDDFEDFFESLFGNYEDEDIDENAVPMSCKTKDVLFKGLVLEYEYDFGSSTELTVTVIEEYSIKADEKIVLLSRNEPLKIMCTTCNKAPATQMCTVCMYEDEAVFCDKCAKKHAKICEDFAEYAAMPVVNSPRMGVCAYEGGLIDTERDGVFEL